MILLVAAAILGGAVASAVFAGHGALLAAMLFPLGGSIGALLAGLILAMRRASTLRAAADPDQVAVLQRTAMRTHYLSPARATLPQRWLDLARRLDEPRAAMR
jgi:hypothetical protein